MKLPYSSLRLRARERGAFTLLETLISTGLVTIAGAAVYLSLTSALNLFAKNTSVNVAHEQLLNAIARITKDVHASVATPTLLNANLSANTGTGPAAGVVVQPMWQRPFMLIRQSGTSYSPVQGTTLATLDTGGTSAPRPTPGQRIIFPGTDLIEDNITAAAANGPTPGYTNVNIQNPAWKAVLCSPTGWGYGKTVIITTPTAYVVLANGELHCYRQQYNGTSVYWQDVGILARGITSATPFSVTKNWTYANAAARTGETGFVAADLGGISYQTDTQTYWKLTATTPTWVQVYSGNNLVTGNLRARTPDYSNRAYNPTSNPSGYRAIDMSVSFLAPYRAKLTTY